MGQSTEELSQEIAETRRSMSSNVDALQDRVSPSAMVERRKAAARSRLRSARERVMGTARDTGSSAKDSVQGTLGSVKDTAQDAASSTQARVEGAPIAAGLIAFGAGLVVASLIPASDSEARAAAKVLDTAEEKGGPLFEEAKTVGREVAHDVADSASEAVRTVKRAAVEGSEKLASEGSSAVDEVRSEARPD